MNIQYDNNPEAQKGQVLLITVMLLAAAITVVMTVAFNSRTETQMTKLEEDSQKALSAAEAALEAAIQKKGRVGLEDLQAFVGSGITGEADIVEREENEFVTPLLQKDEQYTFYLSRYSSTSNSYSDPLDLSNLLNPLTIYHKSEGGGGCPALELILIDFSNNVTNKIIDSCSPPLNGAKLTTSTGEYALKGYSFAYQSTLNLSNMKVMIVRVLNAPTRVGFSASQLRSQGKFAVSEVKTASGTTKEIELFQSHPQIPSDFFVTSF
ncbi:MAG: hypothetical protein WC489_05310 [Patescibacteria group bacterium]